MMRHPDKMPGQLEQPGQAIRLGCSVVIMSVGGSDQYVYLLNALSVVLCVGLGAITGAIVGAIHRDREERNRLASSFSDETPPLSSPWPPAACMRGGASPMGPAFSRRRYLRRNASFPFLKKPQNPWRGFAPHFALKTRTTAEEGSTLCGGGRTARTRCGCPRRSIG
jgi:hypothetical protein